MKSLMQDVPLTLDVVLRRCLETGKNVEVVAVTPAGVIRTTWGGIGRRATALAGVLDVLGVAPGGRVATFAWNTHRHVELFLGVPCAGRVVHGVNVRLTEEEILYQLRNAGDEVLFVDASLTGRLAEFAEQLPVREVVVLDDGAPVHEMFAEARRYEDLLAAVPDEPPVRRALPDDAAWICYTSGTTGLPKGVVSSHLACVLHSMSSMTVDSHAVSREDTLLTVTPLFHVNAWGLAYTAALANTKLVLPGRDASGGALAALIEAERVTVGAAVPTVWVDLLGPASTPYDMTSLRRVLCGGAPATRSLLDEVARRGLVFHKGWGMTEMLPSGTMQVQPPDLDLDSPAGALTRVGKPSAGVRVRLVGPDGEVLLWDGQSSGELEASGPWVIRAYLDPDDDSNDSRFHDGWLRTGDLAVIHPDGVVEIVDRVKDVIKSGGEWISSLALEQALAAHPEVAQCAVVAVPHDKWGERPAAAVVAADGSAPCVEALAAFLAGRVPKWWLPELIVVVDELPLTTVGKYDKKALRARLSSPSRS
ncbi:long-chain-fatty-acid--CoA ligase [Kutzneria sp. CA-103260]|uniref:long-chain-fatty-acid--CoA ligase n=1 Tax=Kutzneria sp. CA-103260 TaxID=2802641 RepID=UPI001BACF69E|nr:long-chain-fatty-acid--CoA ligase [Kutzneria sp. CA-103260]QUQ67729.1 fatty-acyl-CoA synthase [Kutzneria sp. CA-103260]